MVTHPFVTEMGDGILPVAKFREYFLQDYVFVNDLEAAGVLNGFLTGILNPENDLFVRAFRELGASEEEYSSAGASPTTQAFGDFLMRTALEGDFEDIVTVLYVTEGTYLDWGTRLIKTGKKPDNPIYREWIGLHCPDVLGDLVGWLRDHLDGAELSDRRPRIEWLFLTALRYEYMFWEQAYRGGLGLGTGGWPDE